jgi:hypothetical protein
MTKMKKMDTACRPEGELLHCSLQKGNSLAVIGAKAGIQATQSVIPECCNRGSKLKGKKQKGFPLKTCGNDENKETCVFCHPYFPRQTHEKNCSTRGIHIALTLPQGER